MTNSDKFDPVAALTDSALHLNSIARPKWFARPFFDLLAGAIVWSDETNRKTPTHTIWALRFITAYRTGLMIGQADLAHKKYWDLGLQLFPQWVGFLPERREMTEKLRKVYRRGTVETRKCIRDFERGFDDHPNDDG